MVFNYVYEISLIIAEYKEEKENVKSLVNC
jgi:hypothetical protein